MVHHLFAPSAPSHLLVLVNGLGGQTGAWRVLSRALDQLAWKHQFGEELLIHPSEVNQLQASHEGVQPCGLRLANEIVDVVRSRPTVKRLSIVGHSLGGIIVRYAMAAMYSPARHTLMVDGRELAPCHFISLAVPHLGIVLQRDQVHEAPFMRRMRQRGPQLLVEYIQAMCPKLVEAYRGQSGREIMLNDTGAVPLLVRMSYDNPGPDQRFLSALHCFASRTLYSVADQRDPIVSWESSSLRAPEHLRRGHKAPATTSSLDDAFGNTSEPCSGGQPVIEGIHTTPHSQMDVCLANLNLLKWLRVDIKFSRMAAIASHNSIAATSAMLSGTEKDVVGTLFRLEQARRERALQQQQQLAQQVDYTRSCAIGQDMQLA